MDKGNKPSVSINLSDKELEVLDRECRFNTYGVSVSAPPGAVRPRLLHKTLWHNSTEHEKTFTAVYRPSKFMDIEDESDNDDERDAAATAAADNKISLQTTLVDQREQEIRTLEPFVYQQPSGDDVAKCILNELLLQMDDNNTTLTTTMDVNDVVKERDPPSPINSQQSILSIVNEPHRVLDSQLPSAIYGHLDRQSISSESNFNLTTAPDQSQDRFRAKSYAIMACTNVSKEDVKNYILEQFGQNKVEYICVVEDHSQPDGQRWLFIQVIFRERIDRRKPFLKDLIGDICNYNVTNSDLAWNEYIKRTESTPCEYQTFKSLKPLTKKESDSLEASTLLTSTSAHPNPLTILDDQRQSSSVEQKRTAPKRSLAVDNQSEKKRKINDDIARNALALAEDSVEKAMNYIQHQLPAEFMRNPQWYENTFKYVHLRAEEKADLAGAIDKEYVWPDSFPNCTPKLRDTIDRWIKHHFFRAKRAKCLVLVGPTGVGKTSFAFSLPGRVNYFKGQWNLDTWSDYARYSIYDDIPWDEFKQKNFPEKKDLLTQNGFLETASKYRKVTTINVRQPSIVLMNPENAGTLLAKPKNQVEQQLAAYWEKRATVYVLGPDEYFYKPHLHAPDSATTTSTMSPNELRIGGPEEFSKMHERYYEKKATT
ncbi:unnamed protein product [Adineta ricciae]|uniref:Replication-associated protein n=1 Tax=Adineta ricciae TaxID=249248 RepID=A0A816D7I1_ADIRI|nr:unnamed protein product [Adineta ricciae]